VTKGTKAPTEGRSDLGNGPKQYRQPLPALSSRQPAVSSRHPGAKETRLPDQEGGAQQQQHHQSGKRLTPNYRDSWDAEVPGVLPRVRVPSREMDTENRSLTPIARAKRMKPTHKRAPRAEGGAQKAAFPVHMEAGDASTEGQSLLRGSDSGARDFKLFERWIANPE